MKIELNQNFSRLKDNYLFSEIAARVRAYSAAHPEAKIVRLGIGDVTLPLSPTVVKALQDATEEMGKGETFRGYAPDHGYPFLREAVASYYTTFGVKVEANEVYISDGAKSDVGNLTELFGDVPVQVTDPVYPVYVDSNLLSGRRISYLPAHAENGFLPMPDENRREPSLIYLCSPNNPTGAVYTAAQLEKWVSYANATGSLIVFDAAYEAYISGDEPHSIFAIEGARTCAIEICSLSKTAGFTGTRCAWTVIPHTLETNGVFLHKLWERRQATKFNGVPYIIQRAAEAALSKEGMAECRASIAYYMKNAAAMATLLREKGIWFTGGVSSPYLWLRCPKGMGSWEFFDYLLENAQVVGTPGAGFGKEGEGYFRLTAFGTHEATAEAIARLRKLL